MRRKRMYHSWIELKIIFINLYLKSVNNNVSICRCSVKDSVYVYLYTRNKSALLTTYDYAIDVDPEDTISYDDPDWFTKFKTKAPYVEY